MRQTAVSGRPAARMPCRRASTIAWQDRHASLPHRRMQALPLLRARTALVDDGDHAHGHGGLFDDQAVWPFDPTKDLAHRVRQGGDFPDALGHGVDPVGVQGQTIQHDLGDVPPRGVQINGVGGEDGSLCFRQREGIGHPQQSFFPGGRIGQSQRLFCAAGGLENFLCGHLKPPCGRQSGCRRAFRQQCRRAVPGGNRWRSPCRLPVR